MDDHQERAKFELWHREHFGRVVHRATPAHGGMKPGFEYWGDDTNHAWAGWQAARRSSPSTQRQGEEARDAALRVFADAYSSEAERIAKFYTAHDLAKYQRTLDANTITPPVTMGDFRRAYEAIYGAHPADAPEGGRHE